MATTFTKQLDGAVEELDSLRVGLEETEDDFSEQVGALNEALEILSAVYFPSEATEDGHED